MDIQLQLRKHNYITTRKIWTTNSLKKNSKMSLAQKKYGRT